VVLESYVGPPPHELAKEFVNMWRAYREAVEEGIKMPSLPEDKENRFLMMKSQIIQKSRVLVIVTEKKWGIHDKVRNIMNMTQSLDFVRQESQIFHDNFRNQWHDSYIQASKSVAVFEKDFVEE